MDVWTEADQVGGFRYQVAAEGGSGYIRRRVFLAALQGEVKTPQMVDAILAKVRAICEPLGRRVHAVVNYEGFTIDRDVEERYAEMATEAVGRYYQSVTRFTTSAFLRAKLGDALARRTLAPHIFESEGEALQRLRELHGGGASPRDAARSAR